MLSTLTARASPKDSKKRQQPDDKTTRVEGGSEAPRLKEHEQHIY